MKPQCCMCVLFVMQMRNDIDRRRSAISFVFIWSVGGVVWPDDDDVGAGNKQHQKTVVACWWNIYIDR